MGQGKKVMSCSRSVSTFANEAGRKNADSVHKAPNHQPRP